MQSLIPLILSPFRGMINCVHTEELKCIQYLSRLTYTTKLLSYNVVSRYLSYPFWTRSKNEHDFSWLGKVTIWRMHPHTYKTASQAHTELTKMEIWRGDSRDLGDAMGLYF